MWLILLVKPLHLLLLTHTHTHTHVSQHYVPHPHDRWTRDVRNCTRVI